MKVMKSVEQWSVSGQNKTKFPSGQRLRQMKLLRYRMKPMCSYLCSCFKCLSLWLVSRLDGVKANKLMGQGVE